MKNKTEKKNSIIMGASTGSSLQLFPGADVDKVMLSVCAFQCCSN